MRTYAIAKKNFFKCLSFSERGPSIVVSMRVYIHSIVNYRHDAGFEVDCIRAEVMRLSKLVSRLSVFANP